MGDDLIERVAQKICEEYDFEMRKCRDITSTVIAAIEDAGYGVAPREATTAMIDYVRGQQWDCPENPALTWRTMFYVALKGKEALDE